MMAKCYPETIEQSGKLFLACALYAPTLTEHYVYIESGDCDLMAPGLPKSELRQHYPLSP